MQRYLGRIKTWQVPAFTAFLFLAACTTTTNIEPPAGPAEADGTAATLPEESSSVVKALATVNEPIQPEVSETETAIPPVEIEPTPSVIETQPVEATVVATVQPINTTDMTTITEVEILTTDNRSERLRSLTAGWATNWERRTIDYGEILSGGPPRDGIPSIDTPQFISAAEASDWLADNEPVIALEINGEARAYPLQVLTWHEIVNDTVGAIPVVVTFCPLCNSALVFDRRVNGGVVEFGVSGLLRNSDLIMYDRTTETLWQQFTGDAIVGDLVGRRLRFLPSSIVSFADFRMAFPDGVILSRETGFSRQYGVNPYVGYDSVGQNPFLFTGVLDGRLPAMERVVTVSLGELDIAYPLSILSAAGVINDIQAGQDLVIFHTEGTSSALGAREIATAEDVGATGVFNPTLKGHKLTFHQDGRVILDDQTGSSWNILGQATTGPLAGQQLEPIVHADHFWFSWAAFKPDTIIYQR